MTSIDSIDTQSLLRQKRNTKLAHAVVAVLATACGMVTAVPSAMAQTSTGSVYGQTNSGAKVTVKSQDTGLTRELTVGSDGKFEFGLLPAGTYTVTLQKPGQPPATQTARVNPGIGTSVVFSDVKLAEVVVTGTAVTPIDISTAQVSTTFTAEVLRELPIALNVVDVAMLAPGTTKGDSRFGNLASFGGASVAENSYYINGFNVTNLFQNLAYSQLPFYAIESEQVITGSYGPEYGLSTGGVVSLTTKKGSNKWEGGVAATWEPRQLRSHSPRTYTPNGQPFREYSRNTQDEQIFDVWAGGPIIEDTLFFFASGEFTRAHSSTEPNTYYGGNVKDLDTTKPFGLLNVDWNINDHHVLGFTYIQDTRKYDEENYSGIADSKGFLTKGTFQGTDYTKEGGQIYFVRYDGQITDDLSLKAQAGKLQNSREQSQLAANGTRATYNGVVGDFNQPGCPYITSTGAWRTANGATPTSCYLTQTIATEDGKDTRKAGRVDVTYKLPFQLLGGHTFGAGYEVDKWETFYGETYAGGTWYRYQRTSGGVNQVRVRHFQTGANVGVDTNALYLKDDWQLTDNLLLQLGVRSDSFKNLNGNGATYVEQNNIIQPRIAATWDVSGDSSKKLYASYGIYSLPIAATVAVRGASASIFTQQNFTYTGINPATGAPTGLVAAGTLDILNNENGQPLDPDSVASKTLDPTIQEEFVLGYQMELGSNWKAGLRGTYRNLKKTIDDICDSRPFEDWATRNGKVFGGTNLPGCLMINPGYAIDANVDVDDDGNKEMVHLSPGDIGLPKAIRKYYAVELSLEKLWSDDWYTQMSYTWAHNYGNAEGLVKSDIGQDDTGVTQDFDFKEQMYGAYGNLPNDRRHTVKMLAAVKPIPSVTLATNIRAASGRPRNCFGVDPADVQFGYGVSYFYCDGARAPRGSFGRTQAEFNVDLAVAYSPEAAPGLTLKAAVFNVLNSHAVTYYQEESQVALAAGVGQADAGYRSPRNYQQPTYTQLTIEYRFGKK